MIPLRPHCQSRAATCPRCQPDQSHIIRDTHIRGWHLVPGRRRRGTQWWPSGAGKGLCVKGKSGDGDSLKCSSAVCNIYAVGRCRGRSAEAEARRGSAEPKFQNLKHRKGLEEKDDRQRGVWAGLKQYLVAKGKNSQLGLHSFISWCRASVHKSQIPK